MKLTARITTRRLVDAVLARLTPRLIASATHRAARSKRRSHPDGPRPPRRHTPP